MLVLMAVFWVTECIPVAVTGLLPPLILPLTGVLTLPECSSNYWKVRSVALFTSLLILHFCFNFTKSCALNKQEINFMILGALTVGVLVEKSGLHLRIALRIMSLLGDKIGAHFKY